MDNQKICQSCGMPLNEDVLGTNVNGSKNDEYCVYCFLNGEFTKNETMEEMAESCIKHMVSPDISEEQARSYMNKLLPTLKRWKR